MPQIWLTYDELAALMGCDVTEARTAAGVIPLDRRRSRDGLTRAKLNSVLTEMFVDAVVQQRIDHHGAASASELRTVLARMTDRTGAAPALLPSPTDQRRYG